MSKAEEYNGFYVGIVIQNNDPEKMGRVKVFVPHISSTIYKNWNVDFIYENNLISKSFKGPGIINPDLDKIMEDLKRILPWAETCTPLFGGSGSGRYNAFNREYTTSDSNYWDSGAYISEGEISTKSTHTSGFRNLNMFVGDTSLTDAFSANNPLRNRFYNPNANQYQPSDYSNLSRGVFSIPNVGAHVWVFFQGGDANFPVIFGECHGQEDWKRIYSMNKDTVPVSGSIFPDYPESYENLSQEDKIELGKSDPKIDHNQKTFRSKHIINSNKHTIELVDTDQAELLKFTHYSGSFIEFNNNTISMFSPFNNQSLILFDNFSTIKRNNSIYIGGSQDLLIDGDSFTKIGDFKSVQEYAYKYMAISRQIHDLKMLFETMRTEASIHTSTLQKKSGSPAKCPTCQGAGVKFAKPCVTCGGSGKSPSTQDGKYTPDTVAKWVNANFCFNEWIGMPGIYCDGGPSEYFMRHEVSVKKIVKQIRDFQKQITDNDYESKIKGGDSIENITGSKVITIGTVFNDLKSYRVDPVGKIRNQGAHLAHTGTYLSLCQCPLVEHVDVDNVPGGDLEITACNKCTLNVGSKGIRIKTTGPLDIYGSIVNLEGESVNISSRNEIILDGGERIEIRADIIDLKANEAKRNYILADGNLAVKGNTTIIGGSFTEGEVGFIHLTAPEEWHQTEVSMGPGAHSHSIRLFPMTLLPDAVAVRKACQGVNEAVPMPNSKSSGFWIPV